MKKYLLTLSLFILPFVTHAQLLNQRFGGLQSIIEGLGNVVAALLPIAMGLALLAFFWGLAKFIHATGKGDESAVSTGKQLMIWGILALFVMVSIWGIIRFIGRETGIDRSGGGGINIELDIPIEF